MPTRRADLSDTLLRGTTAPVRQVLEHDRLARSRSGDDQTTLTFPDRRHEVDDAGRVLVGIVLEPEVLVAGATLAPTGV